jgi:hypothetical protein
VGREFGLSSGGTEKVESECCLIHESVPFGEREFWVASGEAGEEVCFPGLDSAFGGVAAMTVGRYDLELDLVVCECFFEFV